MNEEISLNMNNDVVNLENNINLKKLTLFHYKHPIDISKNINLEELMLLGNHCPVDISNNINLKKNYNNKL